MSNKYLKDKLSEKEYKKALEERKEALQEPWEYGAKRLERIRKYKEKTNESEPDARFI